MASLQQWLQAGKYYLSGSFQKDQLTKQRANTNARYGKTTYDNHNNLNNKTENSYYLALSNLKKDFNLR